MIPNGKYLARARNADFGFAKTGSEQVAIQFELLEGELAGTHITWYGYFSEATVERTMASLRTCGWATDDLYDLTGIDRNEVSLVIEQDEYEGKTRPRVKWINPVGGGLKERMSDDQRRSFADRMRGHVLASKQNGAPSPAAPKAATQAPAAQGKPPF